MKVSDLADEVTDPGGRPIRELAAPLAQVHWLLQFGPVNLLLTALIPEEREGGELVSELGQRISGI